MNKELILFASKVEGIKNGCTYYSDQFNNLFTLDEVKHETNNGNAIRNEDPNNAVRLSRFKELVGNGLTICDFGCGEGQLIDYLKINAPEYNITGYDKYIPKWSFKPVSAHLVTMIEVVEHLKTPYTEFQEIYDLLLPGGYLYIETSFSDWVDIDNDYCDPNLGHSTVWSHKGLDMALDFFGFVLAGEINRNTRIYKKK